MSSSVSAKSILKQSAQQPTTTLSDEQKVQAERNKRHLDIALQHARLIQYQKTVQAQILKNIEDLADLPHNSPFMLQDAHAFMRLVSIFQPSNIDELVEERNSIGRCGYALCANESRANKMGQSSSWKLPEGGGQWCSNECARKAAHVKAQLSEIPAWERMPGQQPRIVLQEKATTVNAARGDDAQRQTPTNPPKYLDEAELAFERGEKVSSLKPKRLVADRVIEKSTINQPEAPDIANSQEMSTLIEGYQAKRRDDKSPEGSDHDGDEVTGLVQKSDEFVQKDLDEDTSEERQWRDLFANLDNADNAL